MERKYRNKDWLKERYIEEGMTGEEIGEMCNVHITTIYNWLRKLGIEVRPRGFGSLHFDMASKVRNFLDGLLLGDGYLNPTHETSAQLSHTSVHKEYLEDLSSKLESFGIEKSGKIYGFDGGFDGEKAYRLCTKSYRELKDLRERWYPNEVKNVPDGIELAPSTLFNWFIGDGSYAPDPQGGLRLSVLCENMRKGLPALKEKLERLGIECTVNSSGVRVRNSHRKEFFDYILSDGVGIPPCYEYKFPEEVVN